MYYIMSLVMLCIGVYIRGAIVADRTTNLLLPWFAEYLNMSLTMIL